MWIIFDHVDEQRVEKDLLRLLISLEVPTRIASFPPRMLAAEIEDWECALRILNKYVNIVKSRLGQQTRFYSSTSIPEQSNVRKVEGRAEA